MYPDATMEPMQRSDDLATGGYLRRLRDAPADTITRLIEEIGPRPATSLGEARAAALLDGRLRRAGMSVAADSFDTVIPTGWEGIIIGACAGVAVLSFFWVPLLAVVLLSVAVSLSMAALARNPEPLIGRRRPSQNVVATRAAGDTRKQRLVLLARLDTPFASEPITRQWLGGEFWTALRAAAAVVQAGFALIGAFDPQWIWFVLQLPPMIALVIGAIASLLILTGRPSPNRAHDAAGFSVLLSACEGLEELDATEVWAVGLGAALLRTGLDDLLRRYPFDRSTVFLSLEALGQGAPQVLMAEGWPQATPINPLMQQLGQQALQQLDQPIEQGSWTGTATLTQRLRHDGWFALTCACLGPNPTNTPVREEDLEQAVQFVLAFARTLNTQAIYHGEPNR